MKIFADENIPLMTVEALRALGHDVLDIRGTVDEGMPDDNIWEKAQREKRMLITTDKGFADCVTNNIVAFWSYILDSQTVTKYING